MDWLNDVAAHRDSGTLGLGERGTAFRGRLGRGPALWVLSRSSWRRAEECPEEGSWEGGGLEYV